MPKPVPPTSGGVGIPVGGGLAVRVAGRQPTAQALTGQHQVVPSDPSVRSTPVGPFGPNKTHGARTARKSGRSRKSVLPVVTELDPSRSRKKHLNYTSRNSTYGIYVGAFLMITSTSLRLKRNTPSTCSLLRCHDVRTVRMSPARPDRSARPGAAGPLLDPRLSRLEFGHRVIKEPPAPSAGSASWCVRTCGLTVGRL